METNYDLQKFEDLIRTDAAFQEKLKAAFQSYTGEKTEAAVFENILVPLANEYGIHASLEEFQAYMKADRKEDRELDEDEINQLAGGGKGFGASLCWQFGVGIGITDKSSCAFIGYGDDPQICAFPGAG